MREVHFGLRSKVAGFKPQDTRVNGPRHWRSCLHRRVFPTLEFRICWEVVAVRMRHSNTKSLYFIHKNTHIFRQIDKSCDDSWTWKQIPFWFLPSGALRWKYREAVRSNRMFLSPYFLPVITTGASSSALGLPPVPHPHHPHTLPGLSFFFFLLLRSLVDDSIILHNHHLERHRSLGEAYCVIAPWVKTFKWNISKKKSTGHF